ncbi:diguanylate cyclase [Lysobacter yangpyeongensis]|uniref:diguanylate cyclase n=1 Tax=Lysobacter yangpyeongensis TaxID=346182 RepID=A0ABW0SKN1_9GAMM
MRLLGLGAGCVAVGGVLYQQHAAWPWWALLAFDGYVWPFIAYLVARHSRNPIQVERRSLVADSMAGGMWIAVMQLNLLPTVLLAVMLSADKVGVGGWRFLARTATGQLIAFCVTWTLLGFPFRPETSTLTILFSIPFMVLYPMGLSTVAYALGRKVVRQNRELERLSRLDALTGLPNRRQLEEAASTEFSRARRTQRGAALLVLDIDHFKQINDGFGHPIGDLVLKQLAAALQASVRRIDTPGRFGGDEFGVVLTEATLAEAADIAQRIRENILRAAVRFTVSIGVAELDPDIESVGEWVRRADQALYIAKREGRNRVAHSRPADAPVTSATEASVG